MKLKAPIVLAVAAAFTITYLTIPILGSPNTAKSVWITSSSQNFQYLEFYSSNTQNHAGRPVLSYRIINDKYSDIRYLNTSGKELRCYLVATLNVSGQRAYLLSNVEQGEPKCNGELGSIYKSDWEYEKASFEN